MILLHFFVGFDATGRQYDPNGNLVDWWDVQTVENFTLKTQCFIDQVNFRMAKLIFKYFLAFLPNFYFTQ